jgi:hypothetical protein
MVGMCDECQSIYREFLRAARGMKDLQFRNDASVRSLTAWLERLDEDECSRTRDKSELWSAWRRQKEHHILTGHYVPVFFWPGNAASIGPNPN